MSEKVNKANDLYEFEEYYVKTMALTGSRDRFPSDANLVKNVINVFLQQNPKVSQVDIATKYELSPSLFSRFLRTENVKSKPEWNLVAYRLGLDIDLAKYIRDTREVIELIQSWQLLYYGTRIISFIDKIFETTLLMPYSSKHSPRSRGLDTNYENMHHFLVNEKGDEGWFFYYFTGHDILASDVILGLQNDKNIPRIHTIIILNSEKAFEELKHTLRRQDWRAKLHYVSLTVMRIDDKMSTILDEYTDGDLGLARRPEQVSNSDSTSTVAPQ